MASNSVLQPVVVRGWRAGFGNIFRKENRDWWGTKAWLVQAIIWTAILIGILATILFTQTDDGGLDMFGGRWVMGVTIFFAVGGIALSIGAVIMGQEEVLDEKQSGTAAWILSKPVSRTAFIMAKVAANAIGILIIMILLEGALAYLLLSISRGQPLDLLPYLASLGVLYLNVMFYFLLSFMFSAATNSRGAAIGIPMAVLFGYQFIVGLAPWTLEITPWGLTNPGSGNVGLGNAVAAMLALGRPVSPLPIIATILWCVLFIVIAVRQFNRDEF